MSKPLLSALFTSVVLAACASGGLVEQPKALPESLPSEVSVNVEWWHLLSDETNPRALAAMTPVVQQDTVWAATAEGEIFKRSSTGKLVRVGQSAKPLTAPLSVTQTDVAWLDDEGSLTVADHQLVARWQVDLGAVALSPAVFTDQRVFVQTSNGQVQAIERITGRLLWSYGDAEPNLTVTGTSAPVVVDTLQGERVITGLANGKVVALNALDGAVVWEYRIARPTGKTEASRLVDVDAQVVVNDGRVFVAGYQGDLVVIDAETGQVQQGRALSSFRAIALTEKAYFAVNADGTILSLNPTTLETQWQNDDFLYRQPSRVVVVNDHLFVSDEAGFLFVLSAQTGEWLGARHIDWRGARGEPVAYGDGVLLQGNSGRLKYVTAQ